MVTLNKVSKNKRKFGFVLLNPQSYFFKVCLNFKFRASDNFYAVISQKLYIC